MDRRAMAIAGESHRPLFRRVLERITSPDAFPRKLSAGEMRQVYQVRVRNGVLRPAKLLVASGQALKMQPYSPCALNTNHRAMARVHVR